MSKFQPPIVTDPTRSALAATRGAYDRMLVTIMKLIVERFERNGNYPFIDMKLSVLTEADLVPDPDPQRDFKGKTAIYGWAQGRGLESLSEHARWLPRCTAQSAAENASLAERIKKMVQVVFDQMQKIAVRNQGHISFLMTPEGQPFGCGDDGRRQPITLDPNVPTVTDLFYVKGALAASSLLGRQVEMRQAGERFLKVIDGFEHNAYRSDQVSFDPKNRPTPEPGKSFQGGRMLCLGGAALFAERTGDASWLDIGERLLRHVLENHVNRGRTPGLEQFDFYEAIDSAGKPWRDGGRIICDPGHACEWVGLAVKMLLVMRDWPKRNGRWQKLIDECREELPGILKQNFSNGHNGKVDAICKTFDLVSRKPINSDLPWWSLPETMRAAAGVAELYPESANQMYPIAAACSNGFFKYYVKPEFHMMAYQNLDETGKPINVTPGTPDADTGYHTGLSIIDYLKWVG